MTSTKFYCAAFAAFFASPALAVQVTEADIIAVSLVEDTGTIERIESAEALRTYTQAVAAAACFLHNDVATERSAALMVNARAGFDRHLDALLNGNPDMGIIGGEERRKTIVKLEDIRDEWAIFAGSVDTLLAKPDDKAAITSIKAGNMPLFEKTDILVSEIEGQYSNPAELIQADAILLEIVGRQAMLTQKIAKNACKIWSGNDTQEVRDALSGSMQIYEASLGALLNGLPEMGIRPAPTPEIRESLTQLQKDWADVRWKFDAILEGQSMDASKQAALFEHMTEEMELLEKITHKYAIFAKHDY